MSGASGQASRKVNASLCQMNVLPRYVVSLVSSLLLQGLSGLERQNDKALAVKFVSFTLPHQRPGNVTF